MTGVKFGFILPNFGDKVHAEDLLGLSRLCEEEGFDSVWATDHIIMPTQLREPYGQLLEPIVTLAFVAAATDRLKVGTSSIVLPQRNPILVAKQAAALDVFSGGRLILACGVGWAEREFGFLGADFRNRGRIMEEGMKLMKSLWRDEIVRFHGKYFDVEDALFLPKPKQGRIPIWVSGNSDAAVKRAIRVGDGWHPVGVSLERYKQAAERIAESGKKLTLSLRITVDVRKKREDGVGVDGGRRTYFSGSTAEIERSVESYAGAGMEYCVASMLHPSVDEIEKDVRKFSSDIMSSYT